MSMMVAMIFPSGQPMTLMFHSFMLPMFHLFVLLVALMFHFFMLLVG
jgi:hypothetical protein